MNQNKRAGIYIRLSETDENLRYESESESVVNQRIILMEYVKKFGFTLVDEYVDEGYSGQNFNRPGFKRLMEDVTSGRIDTIIVKDLSRFGRDHIDTGYFIENYFPKNNIRFISVLERLDSASLDNYNDSVTFVMACNDFFSQQNSQRIRIALINKMRAGKYVGGQACYGYMKDPEDKNHLIPDPNTAPVVKRIFQMVLDGKYNQEIANALNKEKVITPSAYKNQNGYKSSIWTTSTIKKIITNQLYTGDMVQGRGGKLSYKSDKKVVKPKKDWIIVEDTHEPLVSRNEFEKVSKIKQVVNRANPNREKKLFENLMVCKDCGNSIYLSLNKSKKYFVNCSSYNRKGVKSCISHFMMYDKLEKMLLDNLIMNKVILNENIDRKKIIKIIDRIFIDSDRNITIVMKNGKLFELKYVS